MYTGQVIWFSVFCHCNFSPLAIWAARGVNKGLSCLPLVHVLEVYGALRIPLPRLADFLTGFGYSRSRTFCDGRRQQINTDFTGIRSLELPSTGTLESPVEAVAMMYIALKYGVVHISSCFFFVFLARS